MSKNIIIQKAGLPQSLTVDALRLKKQGGGTEDWVPADEKNLVDIRVKQNGTYRASDFSAYGISEVRVACTENGGSATSTAATKALDDISNPAIKEGNLARVFTTKRLETQLQGGGSCQWVQKSAVELGTKNINVDNKTYKASDDGKYGYSEVVVSGISITTSTDGDGNEVVEHTDGTGTETIVVPSSISLEPEPSFLGPYNNGASISFAGMIVKAYLASGRLWTDASHPNGEIPFSELMLPVTVADASQVSGRTASSDLDTGDFTQPIPLPDVTTYAWTQTNVPIRNTYTWTPVNGAAMVIMRNTESSTVLLFAAKQAGEVGLERIVSIDERTGEQSTEFSYITASNSYTHDGKTVYFVRSNFGHGGSGRKDILVNPVVDDYGDDLHEKEAAWTAVYGDITDGRQSIPVQWMRPGDNEVLETSFDVSVT